MNNALLSKYIPLDTVIHKLDPRSKIFFTISYLIIVFLANTIIEFIILLGLLLVIRYLSKVGFGYLLSGMKLIMLIVIFTSLIHLIFNTNGAVLVTIWKLQIYSGALKSIVLITVRFFLVVALMIIFTITTSPAEITNAIEKSLGFLKKIGINVSTFALLMSISLRFIPTIGEETNRIMNAQISRGANLNTGSFRQRIKNFTPVLIPIFIATLKRADELATAMEVRGYNPDKNRTKYKQLKYTKPDYIVYILVMLLVALTILI